MDLPVDGHSEALLIYRSRDGRLILACEAGPLLALDPTLPLEEQHEVLALLDEARNRGALAVQWRFYPRPVPPPQEKAPSPPPLDDLLDGL